MKIIYLGPSPEVNVGGFEPQQQGEIRDYPDDIGEDLLRSQKQRFEAVKEDAAENGNIEAMTVEQLKAEIEKHKPGLQFKGIKKAELIDTLKELRESADEEKGKE